MKKFKAVVLGGGPAGASAALGFLRSGWDAVVLERRAGWNGRVCGAFLNPEAAAHLEWTGAEPGGVSVDRSLLYAAGAPARAVDLRRRGRAGLAVPRRDLEEALLRRVEGEGGRVRMGARGRRLSATMVEAVSSEGAVRLEADLVVEAAGRFGADGRPPKARGWFGWNAPFEGAAQAPGEMSMHFYPGGYVGAVTFADGSTNVCGLARRETPEPGGWDAVLAAARAAAPSLDRLLAGTRRAGDWRGTGPLPFSLARRRDGAALLVGDAAAVADPFMGEGIGRALSAGPLVQRALAELGGAWTRAALLRRCGALWDGRYAARLVAGAAARAALGNALLFHPFFRLMTDGAAARLADLFHGAAPFAPAVAAGSR